MAVQYGHTWLGRAWVQALEERSGIDRGRLTRGKAFAREDRVTSLLLEPGKVIASVRGSQRMSYRTVVDLRVYDDDGWARITSAIAERAGHVAALLDGDVDPSVLEDARRADADLLPDPGDLHFRCACPDRRTPCKHAAAVCYLVAESLDDDPFTLFALRGRERVTLLAELRDARHAAAAGGTAEVSPSAEDLAASMPPWSGPDEGEIARVAWSRNRPPLPPAPQPPSRPGTPAAWPEDPPADAPFDSPGLLILATDAVHRAWEQLRGDDRSGLALGHQADQARRQAADLDISRPIAGGDPETAGMPAPARGEMAHRALAWHHGGQAGLDLLDEAAWRPPVADMASAKGALEEAGVSPAVLTVTNNRITAPGFQLRLSRAGMWWRFEKRRGRWEVAAPPAESPDDLVGPDT